MVYVIFQQKPDSPAKDTEVEDKGKGKEVGSARLEAVPRAEGLFKTIPDVQDSGSRRLVNGSMPVWRVEATADATQFPQERRSLRIF